ncbi:MAG TPA: DUF1844 domain-containing protein [Candidatus Eisenbacteria bacterium]|nr:DUF1844 domain-containing protein [Candidatus Eisenbacteria bacterium]
MDEHQDKPGGFRVTDRRRFTDAGQEREPGDETPGEGGAAPAGGPAGSPDSEPAEPVTFSTFLLGLSTQALLHLGEIPDPTSGQTERDLVAAKHVIDIIGILQQKTKNNLEQAETGLLESVLYDLRMRYVALVRGTKKEGS